MSVDLEYVKEFRSLGERIRACRKCKGLSRRELAEMLSVSVSSVARYERDEAIPDARVLCDISLIFGVSLNVFVFGYEPPKPPLIPAKDDRENDEDSNTHELPMKESVKEIYKSVFYAEKLQRELEKIRAAHGCIKID